MTPCYAADRAAFHCALGRNTWRGAAYGLCMTAYMLVTAGTWYLLLGLVIAILFAAFVQRLEPNAQGGSMLFRLLIVPGATLLWPLILARVLKRVS